MKNITFLDTSGSAKRYRGMPRTDTPIGNGGVAADGSAWLGLNYGRLARLRLVTGYPGALDWSKNSVAPKNDGIFIIDIKTGEKRLLVSYYQLDKKLREKNPNMKHSGLFINHTLWNRTARMFPNPGGDVSLSPDGNWFVNGYSQSGKNYYAVLRRSDGAFARSRGIDKGGYAGDIRIDPAPRWNRTNNAILVPGIAENGTRQMFVVKVIPK